MTIVFERSIKATISYNLSQLTGSRKIERRRKNCDKVRSCCSCTVYARERVSTQFVCEKKVSFECKGTSFLFHNGAHPLCATRHARVSDYSEDRAYQEEVVRITHPLLSLFPSLSYASACTHDSDDEGVNVLCTDARAVESLSLHLANPHPVYSARNNALDVALPSGRGKHREPL